MKPSDKNLGEQYQKILDTISDGVYSVDLDWRVTYFNRAAEKITGIP
ncbi:MAG: PAS domain-containing protein, partial [Thermodesulfobacteriota bacterium]|nr:PAS domain-containing protein [Thermodesulfobacteriota bacterium]